MPILKRASRTEFPKGGLSAHGSVRAGLGITSGSVAGITLSMAFEDASREYFKEYGQWPDWEKILFRGSFVTGGAVVEICEPQN